MGAAPVGTRGKRRVSDSSELLPVTNDRNPDLPQRSGSFQAMVRAGNSVTAYLRTGRGDPVVLLRRAQHADALWGIVLGEVSQSFRAIVPEHAPPGAEFGPWFRAFLDGLGLGTVRVVSDAHFGRCCADAGLLDPDWLSMLVVLDDSDAMGRFAASLDPDVHPLVKIARVVSGDDVYGVVERTVAHLRERSSTVG